MQIIGYLVTAFTIVGTIANSLKKRWCFYIWGVTNIFWCIYNMLSADYAQALLDAFNFVMAMMGLFKWKQTEGRKK